MLRGTCCREICMFALFEYYCSVIDFTLKQVGGSLFTCYKIVFAAEVFVC